MSEFLYTNNAVTTLAAGINNSVTSLTVATGTGVLFPNPSAGQQFNVTLIDGSGNYEIISVTSRATDVFTIVRAQEGTTAISFLTADRVELRVTAAGLNDMVQETATQTLTNKTIAAGTFTNGYTEESVATNTSTAYTIDLANGTLQILTLTGNCTYTFPTPTVGTGFTLLQKQDGTGSRTVTWPASVKWPASTAPTLTGTASKGDKFTFVGDGTYWWASVAGQNYL